VPTGFFPALISSASLRSVTRCVTFFSVTATHASGVITVSKSWNVDVVNRNRNDLPPLFADQLAAMKETTKITPNLPFDDSAKALVILFDFQNHGRLPLTQKLPTSESLPTYCIVMQTGPPD